jgi:invasion protein IalB
MFNNFFKICGIFLILLGINSAHAGVSTIDDQLTALISRVEHPIQRKEQADRLNSQVARASWRIKCWVRVFEDTKVCVIQKNQLTVIRLEDSYSVSIGSQHQKNSMTTIRIDQADALQAREGLYREALPVIEQMKRGYYLFSRYKMSDQGNLIETKISLMGFTDAFNDMQLQYRRLETGS